MKNIDKNNEGQLLLMTGVILTFTLITMASISVSIADIGLRTSSEQLQQLLFEFDNINTTFWRAYDVELYNAIRNYQNSGKIIERSDIELIFNETLTHMKDIEELRGIRFAATIDAVTIETSKEYIPIRGGGVGTPQDTTVYEILDSNGNIISWKPTLFLSQGLYGSAVVANKTFFYLIGGRDNFDIYSNVSYTQQSRDGLLSLGGSTTPLPFPRAGHAAVIDKTNGRIYVLGGFYATSPQSTVYYANISANGALGNWVPTLDLPTPLYKHSAVIYNNKIYVIGGENTVNRAFDTVYCGEIDAGGGISGWNSSQTNISALPLLPSPRTAQSAAIAIFNNVTYIYVTGGMDISGGVTSTVYYTSIKPDGSLNSWDESSTSLPEPICSHGSTIVGNRLYIIGGRSPDTITSKKVFFTNIISGTTLDTWSIATSLSNAPAELSCWSYDDGYSQIIYVTGGRDNSNVVSTSFHEYYSGSTISCRFSLGDEKSTIKRSLTLEFKNQ